MIRPDRKFILKVLLLLVFLPFYLWAQNAPECSYCGKEITGKYLEAEGKYFHPRHFLCAKCRKVITASFMEKDGKFFHPDCYSVSEGLVCNFCNKIIKSEYVTESGKKYHPDCYESNVAPKCSICGKALTGDYSIDLYNNKYHSYHNRELSRCDNCGRIISERTTKGGKSYSDGRNICNICFKDAVFDNSQINSLLSKVILSLKTLGLQINSKALTI
ncbi:MAG: LIM domain-containing protein, partial [Bacillota bacterium]